MSRQSEYGDIGALAGSCSLSISLKIVVIFAACLTACGALAQESSIRSTGAVSAKTNSLQEKAEDLFDRGEYERAHFIYRRDLAPIGDKYAQYMLGWMYAEGLMIF